MKTSMQLWCQLLGNAGASILIRDSNRIQFVFGFNCQRIPNYLTTAEIITDFNKLETSLKDLPPVERITFYCPLEEKPT